MKPEGVTLLSPRVHEKESRNDPTYSYREPVQEPFDYYYTCGKSLGKNQEVLLLFFVFY